jgi:hypothetical protein
MGALFFGTFTLADPHDKIVSTVVIAPEHILLRRARSAAVHDLSYLAVWTSARIGRLRRELAALRQAGKTVIDATAPEVLAICRAIDPTAKAVFCGAGDCGRAFARRRLKAALRTAVERTAATA